MCENFSLIQVITFKNLRHKMTRQGGGVGYYDCNKKESFTLCKDLSFMQLKTMIS